MSRDRCVEVVINVCITVNGCIHINGYVHINACNHNACIHINGYVHTNGCTCEGGSHTRKRRRRCGEKDDRGGEGEVVDQRVGGGGGVGEEIARVDVVDAVERYFDRDSRTLRGMRYMGTGESKVRGGGEEM